MILTHRDVEKRLEAIMDALVDQGTMSGRSDPDRVNYLRISSFPFCARQWFLNQRTAREGRRVEPTGTLFFTRIGTAVHEIFQGVANTLSFPRKGSGHHNLGDVGIPHNALWIQDWICRECKHRHVFVPHPKACEWCGNHSFKGDEHELTYSKRVLGHMDGTWAFPHEKGAPYSKDWVHIPIDFKTCTVSAVSSGLLPYPANVDQLMTYGALKAKDGYNVPMIALIYITRNSPFRGTKFSSKATSGRKTCVLSVDADKQLKRVLKYEKKFLEAEQCRDEETAMALPVRTRKDFDDLCDYCQFVKLCKAEAQQGNDQFLRNEVRITLEYLRSSPPNRWPKD